MVKGKSSSRVPECVETESFKRKIFECMDVLQCISNMCIDDLMGEDKKNLQIREKKEEVAWISEVLARP